MACPMAIVSAEARLQLATACVDPDATPATHFQPLVLLAAHHKPWLRLPLSHPSYPFPSETNAPKCYERPQQRRLYSLTRVLNLCQLC